MTIYSIGYQRLLGPEVLLRIAEAADAVVVDVRSVPSSRRKGFSRGQLQSLMGSRYMWMGDKLGGRGEIVPSAIAALHVPGRSAILLCMEEHPVDCHRHHAIAVPLIELGVDVQHLYRDELITASALQDALDAKQERYSCTDSPFASLLCA